MKTTTPNPIRRMVSPRTVLLRTWHFALLALVTASTSLHAQSVIMRSSPLRFTVPKGVAYSNAAVLTVVTTANPTPSNYLAVTGIPISGNAFAWLSQDAVTSNATTLVTLNYTNDATIAGGTYELAVEATGDSTYRLPVPVQVAVVWSGVDYTNAVSTNFSAGANWQGGVPPGAADAVVFKSGGGQEAIRTNIIVSSDQEVASMRFSPDNANNRFQTMEIQSGATLKVSGPGLFGIYRDFKNTNAPIAPQVTISGGGTLKVTNANANIGVLVDNFSSGNGALLDMRNLNNFVAEVVRFGMGDFRLYPNYYTNGSVGLGSQNSDEAVFPSRFTQGVYLAKTNIIKCSWVDPNNYNDVLNHDYAITTVQNERQGTSSVIRFSLGLSNAFFIDSICYSQSGAQGGANVYDFPTAGSYALFRGIGGMTSRISVWAQADAGGGPAPAVSTTRGNTVNFANGQVDALIDRMYLGRYRTNITASGVSAQLTIGGASPGTLFDVNTAILGYQDVLNLAANTTANAPQATLNVNSNAIFRVNGTMHLGYTVAGAIGVPDFPESCSGTLIVSSNGTVMASNILAGGVSNKSINNNVRASGGRLIITNGIGTAAAPINNLSITNGSRLTLHNVALGNTNIFVKTFTAPVNGPVVLVNVPVLTNTTWPITIEVISYASGTPSYGGLAAGQLPSGVVLQSIVDSGAGPGVISFTFTTNQPKVLIWRGNTVGQSGTWDTITTNWVTQVGNTPSRFTDGDSVVFDDTLNGSANITNVGNVVPGSTAATYGIVVSNSANNYTFYGDSVLGGASVSKVGTSALTINNTFNPGLNVTGGALSGSGSVGAAILGFGTTMTAFSGTIGGSLEASNANVSVSGTVNGGLVLREGSLTNNGTIIGTASVGSSAAAYLLNQGTMNITVPWSIPTNSILVNNAIITQNGPAGQNFGLTVNGTLRGVGKITQPGSGTNATSDVRVTIGAGGTLDIGNVANEITNMTIAVRLDVNATSTSTFDVDNTGIPVNDKIILTDPFVSVGKVNFGVGNNLGGTLYINKIAGGAFNGGTTIYPFDLLSNSPDNSQPAIPQIIPSPGGGLAWNTATVISNLTLTVTTRPALTNYVTTDGTNGTVSLVFSWPADYRGWRLERQTNGLNVGLESPSTNWTTLATSPGGTNALYFPDITNAPNDFYFRSVQTISTTNDGVIYPAAFYRLNYP